MPRLTVFNDTNSDWNLRPGKIGINGEHRIPAHQGIQFDVPDGFDIFVKVWETDLVYVDWQLEQRTVLSMVREPRKPEETRSIPPPPVPPGRYQRRSKINDFLIRRRRRP